MEERCLQLRLKALNLLAQGGLRDVESGRRSPKMTFLGNRQEVAQVPQLHATKYLLLSSLNQARIDLASPSSRIYGPLNTYDDELEER